MTEGTTEETVEGMSQEKIEQTIKALRDGMFQWKPVRRVYIPKKDGKKRPLGCAFLAIKARTGSHTPDTERAYYEPQFSEHSHGCATRARLSHGPARHQEVGRYNVVH